MMQTQRTAWADEAAVGRFCWLDLAASDAGAASSFYECLFGWSSRLQRANGGSFTRLQFQGGDIGSLYQLRRKEIAQAMPSHWTPYVRVADVGETAARAAALGGEVVVLPFAVQGMAQIALIRDCVGAHVGLWAPLTDAGS